METLLHRTPSIGSLIKKIMTVNPELSAREMIQIIQQSTRAQGGQASEFAAAEVIDESMALSLAKKTLQS